MAVAIMAMLPLVEARAQDIPPTVTITPRSKLVLTGSVNVTIDWCQGTWGFNEATRQILLNGVDVSSQFTTEGEYIEGCEYAERSTGTITLAPGSGNNSFYAGIMDSFYNLGDDEVTYATPLPHRAVLVSSSAGFVEVRPSSANTQAFTIWNTGAVTAKYLLTASCTGAAAGAGCTLSQSGVTIASNASATVTVNYTSKATVGDTGLVAVTAVDSADASVNDQGWTDVTITPAPPAGTVIVSSGDLIERSACLAIAVAPNSASECGDLRVVHELPTVTTYNKSRTPTLLYNSQHVKPNPIVNADVTLPAGGVPTTVEGRVWIGGVQKGFSSYSGSQWGSGSNTRRIAVAVDATTYGTALKSFVLEVKKIWPSGPATYDSVSGKLAVVNRAKSPYGAGWWLAGLEQLVVMGTDSLLWVGGDGSARVYAKSGTIYYAPKFSRRDSITVSSGKYIRWAPGATKVVFSSAGQHDSTVDRLGRATRFKYVTGKPRLDSLKVPSASGIVAYRFTYATTATDTVISQITAPPIGGTARNVTTTRSGANVLTFTDPDAKVVTFTYGTSGDGSRINSRKDKRNKTTTFSYDAGRRLTQSLLTMDDASTIIQTLRAAETRGLPGTGSAAAQPLDSVYALIDGPRSDVTDVTKAWVNGFGAPVRIRDALGKERQIKYDAVYKGLVAQTRDPSRLLTKAFYDNTRGVLDSTKVHHPYEVASQVARTAYRWHAKFGFLLSVRSPNNEVIDTLAYDATTGNRLFEQRGNSSNYRVNYAYNTDGLVKTITAPSIPAESLFYDAKKNLSKTKSPKGYITLFLRDAIGRDTVVAAPIDTVNAGDSTTVVTKGQRVRTAYDVMDRVINTTKHGPADTVITGAGPIYLAKDSLRTEHTYNEEGAVTLTRQRYTLSGVSKLLESTWDYDAALRTTTYSAPSGAYENYTYDKAGNRTSVFTARSKTIASKYDAVNRLTERIVPQVTYVSTPCWQFISIGCSFSFPTKNGPNLCIDADTARFTYDASGNLATANNSYARVKRTYYRNGLLQTDTLRVRTYHNPAPTGCITQVSPQAPMPLTEFNQHIYGLRYRYDLSGRRTALRHPDAIDPCSGLCDSVRYGYDAAGRGLLTSVTDIKNNATSFGYDNAGRLTQLTHPGGWTDVRTYDAGSRLQTRLLNKSLVGTTVDDDLFYDAQDRVIQGSIGYQSGAGPTRTVKTWYAPMGAVLAADAATQTGSVEEFRVDPLGNKTWRRQLGMRDPSHPDVDGIRTFNLDFAGRVESVIAPSHPQYFYEQYYEYDAAGNSELTHSFESDYYASQTLWDQSMSYYGADDRLAVFNRHIGLGSGSDDVRPGQRGVFEEYRYDALGRRVLMRSRRNVGNCSQLDTDCVPFVQRTIWDGDQMLWEIKAKGGDNATGSELESETTSGTVSNGYAYGRVGYVHALGIDQPIGVLRGYMSGQPEGTLIVPHANWRGLYEAGSTSTGALPGVTCTAGTSGCPIVNWPGAKVTIDGAVPDGQAATSWMGSLIAQGSDGSGLHYRRNRYYNPQTGQFTQPDPIGLAGGANLYGFAEGDPVNFSDPFGHCPVVLALAGPTGIAAAATLCAAEVAAIAVTGATMALQQLGAVFDTFLQRRSSGRGKNSGAAAPGQTAGGRATDEHGNVLGPSGRPAVHEVDHTTKKGAKDAARAEGDGPPVHHPSPARGKPHFHPGDRAGQKKPGSPHHNYPP